MYILTCRKGGLEEECGFLWKTSYKKLRALHHSDWLNYIHHFSFTASFFPFFSRLCLHPSPHLSRSLPFHSSSPDLKGVRPDVDGEPEGRAGLVGALIAEQRVHRHHLQVQRIFPGPWYSAGQHQHGTDIIDLLEGMKPYMNYTERNSVG